MFQFRAAPGRRVGHNEKGGTGGDSREEEEDIEVQQYYPLLIIVIMDEYSTEVGPKAKRCSCLVGGGGNCTVVGREGGEGFGGRLLKSEYSKNSSCYRGTKGA